MGIKFFPSKEWYSLLSNFFFLALCTFSWYLGEYIFSILAGFLFVSAFLFHLTKPEGPVYWSGEGQNKLQIFWLYVDSFASIVFAFYVAWLVFVRSPLLEASIIFVGAALALTIYWKASDRYEFEHTLWHILVSSLALLALL